MAYFPRLAGDFAPLFQLLDDYDVHRSSRPKNRKATPVRSFTPKFDVCEVNDVYILEGDLPGAEPSNIEIEFSDPQTLVIKGHVEKNE
ncbi:heat shock protein, partial [Aspergillus brasiliensis]